MSRSRDFALLDERQNTLPEWPWWTGRPVLPGPLAQGFTRLNAAPPLRRFDLRVKYGVLLDAAAAGVICLKGFQRVWQLDSLSPDSLVNVMQALEIGTPRRHLLRAAELFLPDAGGLLRLYAADCAELVMDAVGEGHHARLRGALRVAREHATGQRSDLGAARRELESYMGAHLGRKEEASTVGDVFRCVLLTLSDDPAEAAQGCNLSANQIGRRLARQLLPEGHGLAKMTGDIDRVLTHLLARYDAGQA